MDVLSWYAGQHSAVNMSRRRQCITHWCQTCFRPISRYMVESLTVLDHEAMWSGDRLLRAHRCT